MTTELHELEVSGEGHDSLLELAMSLTGYLVLPDDPGYDLARQVWDATYDGAPGVVVRAANAADVQLSIDFAQWHGLPVAVKSGGHSFAGHSTNDGGLIIDLSAMNAIEIDPEHQTARIEPGATWNEVAASAQEFGLGLTSGDMGTVGVGGLALGGGIGWMARKYGLTIDNLLSVDVVTADGRHLTASATQNAELFWGLRGGGGNFGVATSFVFKLHPAGLVLGGAVIYEVADAERILREYADYATTAPDELTTMATIMYAPPAPFIPPQYQGKQVLVIMLCYAGDLEEGQRVVAPLRALGTVVADIISPMPYTVLFEITKEGGVRGHQHVGRSMFLPRLDNDAIHTIVGHTALNTSSHTMAQLRVLGGKMSRVPETATAFSHRDKPFMFTIIDSWDDPAEADEHRAWAVEFWAAMQQYASGVYVNFLANEGEERIREAYKPATYERLLALKGQYDPTNFFRGNQNINPSERGNEYLDQDIAA